MALAEIDIEKFDRRSVSPGDIIFLDGQAANEAFVILKGDVQAGRMSPEGKFIVFHTMRPGEIFGEMALLRDDGRRTAAAMSEHGCQLLVIPREVFDSHLAKADQFLRLIIGHICNRLLSLSDRVTRAELDEKK